MPIVLRTVIFEYHYRRGSPDVEPLVNLVSNFFSPYGMEKNKILVKILLEFFVSVELLIQQYAGPSAIREEVDQNQLVFAFSLGDGIIQASLEPILSNS